MKICHELYRFVMTAKKWTPLTLQISQKFPPGRYFACTLCSENEHGVKAWKCLEGQFLHVCFEKVLEMRSLKWPSCWWVFRFFLTKCRKKVRKVEMMVEKVPKDHYKTMVTWRNSKKLFLDNFFEKSSEKIALTKKFLKKIYSHFYPRNSVTMGVVCHYGGGVDLR